MQFLVLMKCALPTLILCCTEIGWPKMQKWGGGQEWIDYLMYISYLNMYLYKFMENMVSKRIRLGHL